MYSCCSKVWFRWSFKAEANYLLDSSCLPWLDHMAKIMSCDTICLEIQLACLDAKSFSIVTHSVATGLGADNDKDIWRKLAVTNVYQHQILSVWTHAELVRDSLEWKPLCVWKCRPFIQAELSVTLPDNWRTEMQATHDPWHHTNRIPFHINRCSGAQAALVENASVTTAWLLPVNPEAFHQKACNFTGENILV